MGDFITCRSSAGVAAGAGEEDSGTALGAESAVGTSARTGVPGTAISEAAGNARLGAALAGATAFFSRMRRSPCAYSNSSSPCSDMKESNRSNCPRSIPGTENSALWDCFFDPFIIFQISRSSRGTDVRISVPRGVTTASSSIRIPPTPSMYTPGSRVITFPVSKSPF